MVAGHTNLYMNFTDQNQKSQRGFAIPPNHDSAVMLPNCNARGITIIISIHLHRQGFVVLPS